MRNPMRLAVAATVAAVLVAAAGCASSSHAATATTTTVAPATTAPTATPSTGSSTVTAPPAVLQLPADTAAAVRAAGLQMLGSEGTVRHVHAHLDLLVGGHQVVIPPDVGIDVTAQQLSPLHTHDPSGILHIEADNTDPIHLGQFFVEVGYPLHGDCFGTVCAGAGETLRVYLDGKPYSGAPARLVLDDHQEIVVWIGPTGEHPTVPSTYDFAAAGL